MNLCELPFATLSERNNGHDCLHFKVDDYDHEKGQAVERTLVVKGDPEYGLPTEKDEEIYLGLLKYSSDYNGFRAPEIRFLRAELFDLMGWPKSDWAYKRLTKGLHRLVGVRLSYQNLWRDNRDKQWRDQGAFAILDSFELRDSRRYGGSDRFQEERSLIRWGSVLFQSFDCGYLKRIDYGLARSLSPKARRLYRYLDKHFHPPRKTKISVDLKQLAYQHIGISPGVELYKVRRRFIGPAAEELEQAGYLKPADEERFEKIRRGMWSVTFEMASKKTAFVPDSPKTHPTLESPVPPESLTSDRNTETLNRLILAMCKRGISTAAAMAISTSYEPMEIQKALKVMDEQLNSGVRIRAADRWFQAALEHGYQPSAQQRRTALRPELRLFRANRSRN